MLGCPKSRRGATAAAGGQAAEQQRALHASSFLIFWIPWVDEGAGADGGGGREAGVLWAVGWPARPASNSPAGLIVSGAASGEAGRRRDAPAAVGPTRRGGLRGEWEWERPGGGWRCRCRGCTGLCLGGPPSGSTPMGRAVGKDGKRGGRRGVLEGQGERGASAGRGGIRSGVAKRRRPRHRRATAVVGVCMYNGGRFFFSPFFFFCAAAAVLLGARRPGTAPADAVTSLRHPGARASHFLAPSS